jgi:hypothetical protein
MRWKSWWTGIALIVVTLTIPIALISRATAGSGRQSDEPVQIATTQEDKEGHDHSGWWCAEHGVPEEICSQCNPKVASECKKKGDWCKEHDRAKSQCFKCNPKLKEKFAAQYRAKYGKEPPPTEDDKESEKEKK